MMKMLIKTRKKTYRWRMPAWMKAAALFAVGLPICLALFNVYASAIGHPIWG